MRKTILFVLVLMLALPSVLHSDTRGSVHGKLFDPTGAVVTGAAVSLTGVLSGQALTAVTDADGHFNFLFVDAGPYRLTATVKGFQAVTEQVTIVSGRIVEANLRLRDLEGIVAEASVSDTVDVAEYAASIHVGLSQQTIEHTAGASESLSGIEAFTGTAWRSQEHLHIRGAHQIGFEVNGISIPDQSLFGTVTPFVDPRNFRYMEVTTGGLLPEFGNRTAGVINAITRSGFDAGHRGRLEVAGGNLGRGSAFASFGDHAGDKFAYYVQSGSLVSGRGFNPPPELISDVDADGNGKADALDAPERQDRHNYRRTFQSFANFEWLPNGRDNLNLVLGAYRSDFQVPNTLEQEQFGRDYVQFERDHFQNLRWTRPLSAETLLTVSGYHHFNKLEISGRADQPLVPLAGDNRRADYYGFEGSVARHFGRHLFKTGNAVYLTRLRDDFSVLPNSAGAFSILTSPVYSRVPARSWEESLYVQDQFDATERLSLNFGGRLDIFSAEYRLRTSPKLQMSETFFGPRAGASYRISDHVTLFANGAYLFLPPPIEYFEFPASSDVVSFTPTRPERDVQYDVGVHLLIRNQKIRINQWFKRQIRFLDHAQLTQFNGAGDLINPNIFLPVNLDRGRTHGVEALFESASFRGMRGFVNYSLNFSQAIGGILYGFNNGSEPESEYFSVDHDQRHQVFAGLDYDIESLKAFVNVTYRFGSGFPDASDGLFASCVTLSCRLPKHSEFNTTFGKSLTDHIDARLEIENLTNHVYPINLGSEFNGSHVSAPRTVTMRMAYRF
jgi:outer membrane receptor protein involved in Fe transport